MIISIVVTKNITQKYWNNYYQLKKINENPITCEILIHHEILSCDFYLHFYLDRTKTGGTAPVSYVPSYCSYVRQIL